MANPKASKHRPKGLPHMDVDTAYLIDEAVRAFEEEPLCRKGALCVIEQLRQRSDPDFRGAPMPAWPFTRGLLDREGLHPYALRVPREIAERLIDEITQVAELGKRGRPCAVAEEGFRFRLVQICDDLIRSIGEADQHRWLKGRYWNRESLKKLVALNEYCRSRYRLAMPDQGLWRKVTSGQGRLIRSAKAHVKQLLATKRIK